MSMNNDQYWIVEEMIMDVLEHAGYVGVPIPSHILRTYLMAQVEYVIMFDEFQAALNRMVEKGFIGMRRGVFVDGYVNSSYDLSRPELW